MLPKVNHTCLAFVIARSVTPPPLLLSFPSANYGYTSFLLSGLLITFQIGVICIEIDSIGVNDRIRIRKIEKQTRVRKNTKKK